MHNLTPAYVKAETRPGRYGDGEGLYLQVAKGGTKSWIYRFTLDGKARHLGLGPYPLWSLAEARGKADEFTRKRKKENIQPLGTRESKKIEALKAQLAAFTNVTFKEACARYIAQNEASWKNDKHRQQWRNSLMTYAYPVIGDLEVAAIQTPHIVAILEPIWATKTETASRIRGRVENVLAWAAFAGLRSGANPARWKGHLDAALPKPSKVKAVKHHDAMPYVDLPHFMARLSANTSVSAKALVFTILTTARTGQAHKAKWSEFDLHKKLWVAPDVRVKSGKEHHVELTDDVIKLLQSLPREPNNDFVFIGAKAGKPLSNMAMLQLLKGMLLDQKPTVHGFRASFKTWAAETTTHEREVIEHALAHQLKDKAEAAYWRGRYSVKYRALMNDWAAYCLLSNEHDSIVVQLQRNKTS